MMKGFILILSCIFLISFNPKDRSVPDFSLVDLQNKSVSLSDYSEAKGFIVIFTCNHCPFAKLYYDRLNNLNSKYLKLNLPLIAVNSMDTLLYEDEGVSFMIDIAKKNSFNFPYLQDRNQSVAKAFGATHTPQAFLIWKVQNKWIIKYKGAIDDNGEFPEKANSFISNAIEDILEGREIAKPEMNSIGCKIIYR